MAMATIDLGLTNAELYEGCKIGEVGGRLTLFTDPTTASNIIGRNAQKLVDATPKKNRKKLTLTGPMAVWAYLIVFHIVVHKFNEVWYDDGRSNLVLISKH